MVSKDEMIQILKRWGKWQRSARTPNLYYAVSQYDTPLQKKRNVTPIYKDYQSEKLDLLILQHLDENEKTILELTYVEQETNYAIAEILHCCNKTLINTRNEIIACLRGLFTCLDYLK
jgi:DNA-directed RNA polymerase specialized sigma subunit